MSDLLRDDLKKAVAGRKVAVVVGTGVSAAATNGNSLASWPGLLKEGLTRCGAFPGRGPSVTERAFYLEELNQRVVAADTLLTVASLVERGLGAPGCKEFSDWLDGTVGALIAHQRGVIDAIASLDAPLLTTNYDTLLSDTLHRHPTTWKESRAAKVLRRETNEILHLHGHWRQPDSVVLGIGSYNGVADDLLATALKQMAGGVWSLLFIGCGVDGLSDPDFALFFKWMNAAWRGGGRRHFRLCRSDEAKPAVAGQTVYDISYGENHDDLLPFLTDLAKQLKTSRTGPRSVDLDPWLTALAERTGSIEITGIGSGVGRGQDALRYPIENLYTRLSCRDGGMVESGLGLSALLSRHTRLLIEGQPGAGKTTFARLVSTMLTRDLLGRPCPDGPSWREYHLGLTGTAPAKVPLFLRLSELVDLLAKDSLESRDSRLRLLDLLDLSRDAKPGPEWRAHWLGLLEKGRVMLLLDGLDEVADEAVRRRVFVIFEDALKHWGKCPVVVTSRPFGAGAVQAMDFYHTTIEPFGPAEIGEFVQRWVAALHSLPIGERPTGEAGEKSDLITRTVLTRPAIRRMASNPVMLTCLCVVHWNEGDLPEGRARLYRAVIRWLIAARSRQRKEAGYSDAFAEGAFGSLALAMMGGADRPKVALIDLETAAEAIRPLVERHYPHESAGHRAREWLKFECLWSGILEERAQGRLGYWHLTFQEYLAAQALAWLGDGIEAGRDYWFVVSARLEDLQWRETVDLLPGALFDEGKDRRVDLFLTRILALRPESQHLAHEARVFGLLGRLLGPMLVYGYRAPEAIGSLYRSLGDRILPIFELPGALAVPVEDRMAAAEALGRGGDPRLNGDTLIKLGDREVWLGKYLVTVSEYQEFIDHGGYDEPKWWLGQGWEFRQEKGWMEPDEWARQTEHPNRPVVGVSWYEAAAYCLWRSRQQSRWSFRLPKEKEWEAAAMPDGREYPWGAEEPTPDLANYDAGNVGSATPVGVYPAGNGPLGHCDLAGNVWEWSEGGLQKQDVRSHVQSVTNCGGSWRDSFAGLRVTVRYRNHALQRGDDLGFRVAAAASTVEP